MNNLLLRLTNSSTVAGRNVPGALRIPDSKSPETVIRDLLMGTDTSNWTPLYLMQLLDAFTELKNFTREDAQSYKYWLASEPLWVSEVGELNGEMVRKETQWPIENTLTITDLGSNQLRLTCGVITEDLPYTLDVLDVAASWPAWTGLSGIIRFDGGSVVLKHRVSGIDWSIPLQLLRARSETQQLLEKVNMTVAFYLAPTAEEAMAVVVAALIAYNGDIQYVG